MTAPLDFEAFHTRDLPQRMDALDLAPAARSVRRVGSLAFRLEEGGAWTYAPAEDGIRLCAGDERADTVMELSREAWEGIVRELETGPGLLYGGRIRCLRGEAMHMIAWEPALRALYNGRPLFDPNQTELLDRHGAALDVEHCFGPEDDREDQAHFLRTAGYLFVRDVFSADEVAAMLAEAQELRAEARKGDRLSWWGRDEGGAEVLCRVTRGGAKTRLATLPGDPRLLAIKDLADEPLAARTAQSDEGVSVIYKNPGMQEGLSDLPWHRDCGMGGHAVMCPILIVSVYLTEATPETGELRMLPGSWQGSVGYMNADERRAPRGASFAARPGDVSAHYGDVMHAAPAPTGRELPSYRISAVTAYARPGARHHRGDKNYNEVLHGREDGQIEHLSDVARRSDRGDGSR